MGWIAPVIAAVSGAGTIGSALISVGVSAALGFVARKLAPEPRQLDFANFGRGQRLTMRVDPNAEREIIFGEAATAGTIAYRHVYGQNEYLQDVLVLADHECDSLQKIYVNGRQVTWNPVTGAVSQYPGVMTIKFYSGAYTQAAAPELVANSGGRWTSNDRGRGICYVTVTLKYDEKLFPEGRPEFLFVVRGAKLYDWRKDSTQGGSGSHRWGDPSTYEWTNNPAVCLYNYRRGIYVGRHKIAGMNTPAAALPLADWTAAANACDETVTLKGGGSEKRYRLNGVLSTAETHRENIRSILTACAGREIDSGGTIRPFVGVSQTPVLSITDDDLWTQGDVRVTPRFTRDQLVNSVFGSFHDPAQAYAGVALPPRISNADIAADGGVTLEEYEDWLAGTGGKPGLPLEEHYALDLVTSGTQGQRVTEIFRRRGRYQTRAEITLRPRFAVLEAGDWITWTSERRGWVNKVFEVTSVTMTDSLVPRVTLQETAAQVYAWSPATDELDPQAPAELPAGASGLTMLEGFTLANALITAGVGSSERPALHATWTPPADPTVVEILIQYRKAGDTVPLEVRVLDPSQGTHTWADSVVGNTMYEARARIITRPERSTDFTPWVTPAVLSAPFKVDVAVESEVADDSVTIDQLSPQARFELSLVTAVDSVLGSVSSQIAETNEKVRTLGESIIQSLAVGNANRAEVRSFKTQSLTAQQALARQITEAVAQINNVGAQVQQEITARIMGDNAVAQSVDNLATVVGENAAIVTVLAETVDGIAGKWGVAVNVNGDVLGLVQLDANAEAGSQFVVQADRFLVAQRDLESGDPVPVFAIDNVNGAPKLALRGDMVADGTISARMIAAGSITAEKLNVTTLDAVSSNLGTVRAGRVESLNGKSWWDLNTGDFVLGAP